MITGIFYPDQGEIIFQGKKFDPIRDVGSIGYMPEERGLYKKMKVGEQALYLAQLKGLSHRQAKEKIGVWFERFGMESWWNKKVEDLSKGMGQKLQFVTTVLHDPRLIILDEPFSGLDPVNSNLIKDEIYRLAANGATIIFSTHRMEQVEEICNNIALVNRGKKILDGTVAGVKEQFKENLFLVETEGPFTLSGEPPFTVVNQTDAKLFIQLSEGQSRNQAIRFLLDQQVSIVSFKEMMPSLNDIFIKLVEGTPVSRSFESKTAQP
jgi:ABC-2 type transport system ATP-binding protein